MHTTIIQLVCCIIFQFGRAELTDPLDSYYSERLIRDDTVNFGSVQLLGDLLILSAIPRIPPPATPYCMLGLGLELNLRSSREAQIDSGTTTTYY